jgi:hypothetical protein
VPHQLRVGHGEFVTALLALVGNRLGLGFGLYPAGSRCVENSYTLAGRQATRTHFARGAYRTFRRPRPLGWHPPILTGGAATEGQGEEEGGKEEGLGWPRRVAPFVNQACYCDSKRHARGNRHNMKHRRCFRWSARPKTFRVDLDQIHRVGKVETTKRHTHEDNTGDDNSFDSP